jgi:hypothetical protein
MEPIKAELNTGMINADITKVKEQCVVLATYYEKLTGAAPSKEMPDILQRDRPKSLYDLQVLLEDVLEHRDNLHTACQNAVDEIQSRNTKAKERIANFAAPKLAPAVQKK